MDWEQALTGLREKRAALESELDGLLAKAEPTSEEMTRAEAINDADIPEIDKRLALTEKRAAEQKRLEGSRGVRAGRPDVKPAAGNGTITDMRLGVEDDPKRGFRSVREFLSDVIAQTRGARVRNADGLRLLSLERIEATRTAGSDEAGVYADPYGGYLVPEGFAPNLLSVGAEADPLAGRTMNVPMAAPKISIPARTDKDHSTSVSGGFTVGRSAETVSKTASRGELERITLSADSLFGLTYATEELLTDSAISFIALIEAGFRSEFASQIFYERLYGTGVGQFLGIMSSPALVTVAKEGSQSATTINFTNLLKMRARCWGYRDAIWIANHDTMPQLGQLSLAVGTGGSAVWALSAREDVPDVLLGRPLFFSEYCQTLGTTGDILLVNATQILEGTYQPMQSAESIHVRFLNHERAFKFWLRNCSAPWWRSALTPKKGTNTLSPIVALATRA